MPVHLRPGRAYPAVLPLPGLRCTRSILNDPLPLRELAQRGHSGIRQGFLIRIHNITALLQAKVHFAILLKRNEQLIDYSITRYRDKKAFTATFPMPSGPSGIRPTGCAKQAGIAASINFWMKASICRSKRLSATGAKR